MGEDVYTATYWTHQRLELDRRCEQEPNEALSDGNQISGKRVAQS